jgi:type IV pilus assembly protein PilE
MRTKQRGVTLMELLVVMVVVGLLSAIAIPSYRQYVVRANRSSAKIALTSTAQALERCYNNSTPYAYDSEVCEDAVALPFTTADGWYRISGDIEEQTYTLTATPQKSQAKDSKCENFTLTSANQRGVSGADADDPTECWGK